MASISKETNSIEKGSSLNSDATDFEAQQLPVASFGGGVRVQRVAELNKGDAGVQEVRSGTSLPARCAEPTTVR